MGGGERGARVALLGVEGDPWVSMRGATVPTTRVDCGTVKRAPHVCNLLGGGGLDDLRAAREGVTVSATGWFGTQ